MLWSDISFYPGARESCSSDMTGTIYYFDAARILHAWINIKIRANFDDIRSVRSSTVCWQHLRTSHVLCTGRMLSCGECGAVVSTHDPSSPVFFPSSRTTHFRTLADNFHFNSYPVPIARAQVGFIFYHVKGIIHSSIMRGRDAVVCEGIVHAPRGSLPESWTLGTNLPFALLIFAINRATTLVKAPAEQWITKYYATNYFVLSPSSAENGRRH